MAVEALDEILDYGYDTQPLPENKVNIDKYRPIGLGVFGLADMFVALGIRYGSEDSTTTVQRVMSVILEQAMKSSASLARKKGAFGEYADGLYDGKFLFEKGFMNMPPLRNGSLLSIAPTGTIATMCGISGGIEPFFKISYDRTTHSLQKEGKYFKVYAKSVEHLLRHNGLDPDKMTIEEIKKQFPFVVDTYDIDPMERVAVQSAMQEYVDNAISSTINLKESATVEDVFNIYIKAWESGCKGLTVFRQGCARNAIIETTDKKVIVPVEKKLDSITPLKRGKQRKMDGSTFVGATACVPKLYTTVNIKEGNIFELFTNVSSGCKSNINVINRLASLAIRSGVEVREVIGELKSNICPACSTLKSQGNNVSMSCGSCIGEALEEAYLEIQGKGKTDTKGELLACPECHEKTLRPEGKCFTCSNCGYSRCD